MLFSAVDHRHIPWNIPNVEFSMYPKSKTFCQNFWLLVPIFWTQHQTQIWSPVMVYASWSWTLKSNELNIKWPKLDCFSWVLIISCQWADLIIEGWHRKERNFTLNEPSKLGANEQFCVMWLIILQRGHTWPRQLNWSFFCKWRDRELA